MQDGGFAERLPERVSSRQTSSVTGEASGDIEEP
jgi:hypothetical protein